MLVDAAYWLRAPTHQQSRCSKKGRKIRISKGAIEFLDAENG